MIRYSLSCPNGHGFEGWFPSSAGFETQVAEGQVACPVCGATDIAKAPMAPRIGRSGAPAQAERRELAAAAMVGFLRAVRKQVEATAEPVGPRFAAEARAIHAGDAPDRPIYGEATEAEAEALEEDGIPVARIPWVADDA